MAFSKLQNFVALSLHREVGHLTIKENYRPDWLKNKNGHNLELDFYIPDLSVAIEVQGEQHFKFNSKFHKTFDDFLNQLVYDRYKRDVCDVRGIRLFEVTNDTEADDIIAEIECLARPVESRPIPVAPARKTRASGPEEWSTGRWGHVRDEYIRRSVSILEKVTRRKTAGFKSKIKGIDRYLDGCSRSNRYVDPLIIAKNIEKRQLLESKVQQEEVALEEAKHAAVISFAARFIAA